VKNTYAVEERRLVYSSLAGQDASGVCCLALVTDGVEGDESKVGREIGVRGAEMLYNYPSILIGPERMRGDEPGRVADPREGKRGQASV